MAPRGVTRTGRTLTGGGDGRDAARGARWGLGRALVPAVVERLLPSRFHLVTVTVERAGMPWLYRPELDTAVVGKWACVSMAVYILCERLRG